MNDERDEILDELRALISIEPAPGFEGRVRREVQNRARSGSRAWWMGAAALAGATAVIALVTSARPTPGRELPTAVSTAAPTPPVSPVTVAPQPAMAVRVRVSTSRVSSPPKTSAPEVLVPPDQAIALRKLMAAVRDGRTILAPVVHDDDSLVVDLLPKVAPIKVDALPGDPAADVHPDIDSRKAENHVSTQV